ncbi:MAG: sulfate ABC transporter permease subunit [Planctomycetota bacterium]|nr:MAG: sulfate ABC transporter permease subunit [Planctomycetota bacterium]
MGGATRMKPPKPQLQNSMTWPQRFLIIAVLAWFGLLILGPAVALARRAFAPGVGAVFKALTDPDAIEALLLTAKITVVVTISNTIFGIAMAIVLVRQRFWGRRIVDGLLDLPFAVSPVIAGLMLIILYGPKSTIGSRLESFGFPIVYHLPGMILAGMFVTLPLVVRSVAPILEEIGSDQEDVASTLGADCWTTFHRITLPTIRWGVAYGAALVVARSLGEFGALLVVSGNIIGRTQTATLYVHDQIESFEPHGAYVMSIVLATVSFCILVGLETIQNSVRRREYAAEAKEDGQGPIRQMRRH